jgi:hypothetical protein
MKIFQSLSRGVVASVIVVTALAVPAAASVSGVPEPTVPADVAALMNGRIANEVQQSLEDTVDLGVDGGGSEVPDFSGDLQVGPIHQVYAFTTEFGFGDGEAVPVEPAQEWLAALVLDGDPVGSVRAWKPDHGSAELAGFDTNSELGASLLAISEDAILVEDAQVGTFYTLDGDVLTPLSAGGAQEFSSPVGLDRAASVIGARNNAAADNAKVMKDAMNGSDVAVGGGGIAGPAIDPAAERAGLIAGALAVVGLAVLGAFAVMRHRRQGEVAQ